jgi:hypothetical protein
MYMHCLHSLFCQLLNCNLFTQHVIYLYGETPLVNCGPRFILLHSYYRLPLHALFTFSQTNIFYHTICLILCLQQTGEIENLTASWSKVLWLCCVQVPRCCWCRASINKLSGAVAKPASINLRKLFLSPTGSIKPWFHTEGNLPLCSSYLPLGVPNWVAKNRQLLICTQSSAGCYHHETRFSFHGEVS